MPTFTTSSTRRFVAGALVVAAASWPAACGRGEGAPRGGVSGGRLTLQFFRDPAAAPPFTVRDLGGREISAANLRGKVTIVNFWATWCPPCRAEIPELIALQEKYPDRLAIVGIATDEGPPEVVRRFVAAHHITYAVAPTTPALERAFGGISALPTSFVLDRDGRIVQKHIGMLDPVVTEAEARALAGLDVDATIERVDPTRPTGLPDAAEVTAIPGLDLTGFAPGRRTALIQKLNDEPCTCGCGLSIARCRVDDPTCGVSLPLARQIASRF